MEKEQKSSPKFTAAALFAVAAIFSFSTPIPLSFITGIFFATAAIFYLFAGINISKSEKRKE